MALLSYNIAGEEDNHALNKNSAILSKPSWFDILLEHFDIQWLEALYSLTVIFQCKQYLVVTKMDANYGKKSFRHLGLWTKEQQVKRLSLLDKVIYLFIAKRGKEFWSEVQHI